MTCTTLDAVLNGLNTMTNMDCGLLNIPLAYELEAWNVWFNPHHLVGSSENPLTVLQALIIDPVREDSLYSEEFERITELDAKYMSARTLDDLTESQVFEAVGKLFMCYLAAGRNQAREIIREGLPYVLDPAEEAVLAVEAWRARRAARMAPEQAARTHDDAHQRTIAAAT